MIARGIVGLLVFGASACAAAANTSTLSWNAKHEKGVYGYLIYRSEQRQGPFVRINARILKSEAKDDADANVAYRYVDNDVKPGHTYYYYVDAVGTNARKQKLSGVLKKQIPADGS